MTKTELLEIISNGENSGVEFKRDDIRPEELAKECVALSNLKGGIVLLGVEDDKTISGLTRDENEIERWIMDTVFGRYITPPIIPYYEQAIMDNNLRIGILQLERGISKPYAVKRNDREDIYIRVGSISKLANREQIIRLAQESGFHSEVLPVSGSGLDDIDLNLVIYYLNTAYKEEYSTFDKDKIVYRLEQLDLVIKNEKFGWIGSLAGILLFGKNPKRFLHQSGFRIIGYKGDKPDYDTFIDEEINLPIAEIRNSKGDITQMGLISLIIEKLKPFILSEVVDNSGARRQEWLYPFEVIRELIVNSLSHRDWTKSNSNKIELFSDRFEITSFGSLPNTLTWEKVVAGQQYPRNPLLIRIIKDYGYMDDRGLGIRRKVIPILREKGYPEIVSESSEDFVKLIVYRKRTSPLDNYL